MAETPDGMAALRQKAQRRSRVVPPPRHPAKSPEPTTAKTEEVSTTAAPPPKHQATNISSGTLVADDSNDRGAQRPAPRRTPTKTTDVGINWLQDPVPPDPNEPMANLAIRVRKSLDDRLADVVHDLRRQGIRSSKAEVVELLIATLPSQLERNFTKPLSEFRARAPRP